MKWDIPHDAYYRARKFYGIASAILLVWVVIGINVDQVELAGAVLKISRPQWIPWLMVVLVLYGAYRYNHERAIYNDKRRQKLAESSTEDQAEETGPNLALLHNIEQYVLNTLAGLGIVLLIYDAFRY